MQAFAFIVIVACIIFMLIELDDNDDEWPDGMV